MEKLGEKRYKTNTRKTIYISVGKSIIDLLLIVACQFFGVFHTSSYIYSGDLISVATILIMMLAMIISNGRVLTNKYTKTYTIWLWITLLLLAIQTIRSTIIYHEYGQSFVQVLSVAYVNLTIFSILVFAYYQEQISDIDFLKNMIVRISFIAAVFSILQVFLYSYGITILDIGIVTSDNIRYGTLRFGVGTYIIPFGLMITLFDAINTKNKRGLNLIYTFTFAIFLIYAAKTRTLIMYITCAIYIIIIFALKSRNIKIMLIIGGSLLLIYSIYSGIAGNFILELSNDSGVNIRFDTINYYWKEFLSHPLLGMGYIKTSSTNEHLQTLLSGPLYYGKTRYYYRDDVGFIGLLNENGIFGGALYIIILALLFKQSLFLYRLNSKKYIWALAICFFILFCMINLIYTKFYLAIAISVINHYYYHERLTRYE